jgi:flagella basal body P-ring formation protein FlgA
MKQVSNSLLTLYPIPFAFPDASAFPRDIAGANGRRFTPFYICRKKAPFQNCRLPGLSCSPRSFVRIGLGEGSVRSLLLCLQVALSLSVFILSGAPGFSAAQTLVIDLKHEAAVASDMVHLGDIANVHGSDSSAVTRLNQVALGSVPEFGRVSEMTRQEISSRMPGSFSAAGLSFEGASSVQIRRRGQHLNPDDITEALLGYIEATTFWERSEIKIQAIGNLNEIELPPGDIQLRLGSGTTPVGRNRLLVPMEGIRDGKTVRSFWIPVDVSIHARILTASRKIPYSRLLTPDDVVESVVDITDFRNAYVRQAADLIGKVSRRSFAAGAPLTREAFTDPIIVRHGETVQLRLEKNGILLTAPAKAEQDGKLGQIIIVRNLEFSTALKAQVTGAGVVKIP